MSAKTTKAAAPSETTAPMPKGKLGLLIQLLKRPEGASLAEMAEVTGWQNHSVRGVMSGAIKKKLGLSVTSSKADGGRRYRIVEPA